MIASFRRIRHRRQARKLERIIPNPRSSSPKGHFRPLKRESYATSVLITALGRLAILAGLVVLAIVLYPLLPSR
jgi:hypothetical protein